jgi:hypothetical protein
MTGVSSFHVHNAGSSLWIKSILPFLPQFIVRLIVFSGLVGSMPQPKFGYFIEKPTPQLLMPRVAIAAKYYRNPDYRKLVLKPSTQALRAGLALKGMKRI